MQCYFENLCQYPVQPVEPSPPRYMPESGDIEALDVLSTYYVGPHVLLPPRAGRIVQETGRTKPVRPGSKIVEDIS